MKSLKKPLTKIISISFLINSFLTFAQPSMEWGYQTGGSHNDIGAAMALDSSNNIFMTGRFMDDIDFDPSQTKTAILQSTEVGKVFISKSDENGNLLWAKTIGESVPYNFGYIFRSSFVDPTAIGTDADGNVYVTGTFTDVIDFDPGVGVYNLTASDVSVQNYSSVFILKLDPNGNFVWANKLGENKLDVTSTSIKIDKNNNLYLLGVYTNRSQNPIQFDFDKSPTINAISAKVTNDGNSQPYPCMYILKLTSDGNFIWVKNIDNFSYASVWLNYYHPSGSVDPMALDADANILIGGRNVNDTSTIDFDPGTATYNESITDRYYSYVLKLDSTGAFKWVNKTAEITTDVSYARVNQGITSLSIDKQGLIYYIGNTLDDSYNIHNFIGKLDKNGGIIWEKEIQSSFLRALVVNTNGDLYVTGTFQRGSVQDLDPGNGVYNFPNGSDTVSTDIPILGSHILKGDYTHNLLKLNSNGDLVWMQAFGTGCIEYSLEIKIGKSPCELFLGGTIGFSAVNSLYDPPWPYTYLVQQAIEPHDYDPGPGVSEMSTPGFGEIYITKFNENPTPVITPLSSVNFCEGDSVVLDAGSGYASYSWTPTNETTRTITVKSTGDFLVTTTTVCGTKTSLKATTSVNPAPNVKITGKNSICIGDVDTLTATGAKTYSWNTGSLFDTTIVAPTVATLYKVTGTDSIGCVNSDSINVTLNTIPVANAGNDQTICANESIILTGTGGTDLLWSTGAKTNSISVTPTDTTTYIYHALNGGCEDVDSITVFVVAAPIVTLTPESGFTMMQGGEAILTATGGGNYLWSPSVGLSCTTCPNPTAKPSESTEYCVTVTNIDKCTTTKCIPIKVDCGELFVPTGFSPNGDNNNDVLEVKINPGCVDSYDFSIFDRWGEKVFQSANATETWDGKYNGTELDNAVFVYYLKIKLKDSTQPITKKGNISIIR